MQTLLYFPTQSKAAAPIKLAGVHDAAARRGAHVQVVERKPSAALVRKLAALWEPIGAVIDCGGEWGDIDPGIFGPLPAVFLDHAPAARKGMLSVRLNSEEIGRVAARELLSTGRKHFACVPFPEERRWSDERTRAFATAVRLHGLSCETFSPGRRKNDEESDAAWQRALRTFLKRLPKPCALFAANDATAADVLAAANYAGIKVPDELAVLGVDDHEAVCERTTPTLSSIAPGFHREGTLAAELLFDAVEGRAKDRAVTVSDRPQVVRRASTMPLRRVDACVESALERIRREACAGLRPAQVAGMFQCSRRMADKRFRNAVGRSIGEEIHAVQSAEAKRILRGTDRQLETTAAFCGFSSPGSFRKFFRRETGVSLSAWRKGPAASNPTRSLHAPDDRGGADLTRSGGGLQCGIASGKPEYCET